MSRSAPWTFVTTGINTTGQAIDIRNPGNTAQVPNNILLQCLDGTNAAKVSFDGGTTFPLTLPVGAAPTPIPATVASVFVKAAASTTQVGITAALS